MTGTSLGTTSVFVPVTHAGLRELIATGRLDGPFPAYGVTAGLVAWGEFEPDQAEDALFAAQSVAGVAALLGPAEDDPRRIVLSVSSDDFTATGSDEALGGGGVDAITWRGVEAVFADDPAAEPEPLLVARRRAADLSLVDAWDDPELARFVADTDLGWFTPAEAARWFD